MLTEYTREIAVRKIALWWIYCNVTGKHIQNWNYKYNFKVYLFSIQFYGFNYVICQIPCVSLHVEKYKQHFTLLRAASNSLNIRDWVAVAHTLDCVKNKKAIEVSKDLKMDVYMICLNSLKYMNICTSRKESNPNFISHTQMVIGLLKFKTKNIKQNAF